MLEIYRSQTAVISCRDEAAALDKMPQWSNIFSGRVAPDELLLIGPASTAQELLQHASDHLKQAGTFGAAMDLSDAWAVWTVVGENIDHIWALLSQNPLPAKRPAFVQGAVASMSGKAIVLESAIHFLTPASVGYHLYNRLLRASPELHPHALQSKEFVLHPSPATFPVGAPR